jgi:hypothetical protein
MSNFTMTTVQRNIVAFFAAIVFSATCVGAAVGPASAVELERVQVVMAA